MGYLPDAIAFNDKGTKLVIANEGEPANALQNRSPRQHRHHRHQGPSRQGELRLHRSHLRGISLPDGIRLSGPSGTTQATDIEPEYVSILGNYAYVTLQENNGVAKVNLASNTVEKIFALGTIDYKNLLVDLSDKDGPGGGLFAPRFGQAFEGLRMPDAIAAFNVKGRDYFVTANEGDGRDGATQWGAYSDETAG